MYGFVEVYPANIYDSVEIPTRIFQDTFKTHSINSPEITMHKLETIFNKMDLIDENSSLIVGYDGILNEDECLHALQV